MAENFSIHAMMDVSDGLAGDLPHILRASGVGAELLKTAVPISRAAKENSKRGDAAKPAFVAALTDGEDFELVFTVASTIGLETTSFIAISMDSFMAGSFMAMAPSSIFMMLASSHAIFSSAA